MDVADAFVRRLGVRRSRRSDVICATMTAACVLGLSAGAPQAQAADFNQPAINATLAFSPTNLGDGQYTNLCAINKNKVAVTVNFVIQTPGLGTAPLQTTIQPGQLACGTQFSVLRNANAQLSDLQLQASIELLSPDDCSQATEYPGKCRLIASLEIAGDVTGEFQFSGTFTDRIHLEPVLLPFVPGRRIPIQPVVP